MTSAAGTAPGGFRYRAVGADGRLVRGRLHVGDRDVAVAQLRAEGLFPVDLVAERDMAVSRSRRISARDLGLGLRALATLMGAGLPADRALAVMEDVAPASWSTVIPRVRQSLTEGRGMATAITDAIPGLPRAVAGMLQAGEEGAGLATSLERAAEYVERQAATRAALRGALAYPALLLVTGAASVAVLVGVVLPRFATILGDLGQRLPPTTRLVLAASEAARAMAVPSFVVGIVVLVAGKAWSATPSGRVGLHALLLHLPLFGEIRRSAATARACATLATLLESGVPAPRALSAAAESAGDHELARRLAVAREEVMRGAPIAAAAQDAGALTPAAVRLVRAGEESGRLVDMLRHAASLESDAVDGRVRTLVRVLEPALIVGFGGLIALVAAALLQAVYAVRPTG